MFTGWVLSPESPTIFCFVFLGIRSLQETSEDFQKNSESWASTASPQYWDSLTQLARLESRFSNNFLFCTATLVVHCRIDSVIMIFHSDVTDSVIHTLLVWTISHLIRTWWHIRIDIGLQTRLSRQQMGYSDVNRMSLESRVSNYFLFCLFKY
jgi:hypothetical protein